MKKILYLLSIAFIMLQSCSSDNNSENSNSSGNMLLKRVEYSDISVPIYFKYNGTKLNYFSYGETGLLKKQFTYSGDLITKTEWFENGVATGEKQTYSYLNNMVIEERTYSPGAILEYIRNVSYNSDGSIDVIVTGYNGNSSYGYTAFIDSNNNIIQIGDTLYEYDNMNNPYKNITGYYKLYLGNGGNNNCTQENTTYGSTYNYQYNSQNYPISCEILEPGQPPVICNYYY
jgi:hypothetical protein